MKGAVLLATGDAAGAAGWAEARTIVTTAELFAARPAPSGPAIYLAIAADAPHEPCFAAAAAGRVAGIWLTRCVGLADLERAGTRLAVAEAQAGLAEGTLAIVASVGSAAGVLALPRLGAGTRRLAGFALNEGALRQDLGIAAGAPAPAACLQARGLLVLAAGAARVPAIDAITAGSAARPLEAAARAARQDGFAGKLAAGPDQVAPIERAFA